MSYANISYEMPAEHLNEVNTAINMITTRLPFLVNLSPDERQQVLKLAPRDGEFVSDMQFAISHFPEIFPTSFGVPEYQRDVALFEILSDVRLRLESLIEKIRFTEMALGGEVMKATHQGYQFVQQASKYQPGLQSLAEKMKYRYKNSGRKKAGVVGSEEQGVSET